MSEQTKGVIFALHLLISLSAAMMTTTFMEFCIVLGGMLASRLLLWLWLFPEEFRKKDDTDSEK